MKNIFILFIAFVGLSACSHNEFSDNPTQGIIEYDVTYIGLEEKSLMKIFLPEKMIFTFKDDKTVASIEALFGSFQFKHIINPEKEVQYSLLTMNGQNYCYEFCIDSPSVGDELLQDLDIEEADVTKIIAGYECKKAIVNPSDELFEPYEIYYTQQLGKGTLNEYNPYKDVDGVLLQFRMFFKNMQMVLTANNVTLTQVENTEFELTKEYNKVNRKEFENLLKSF